MIVVIADDFTGAAELGGLGLRYGMSVEIETEITDDCKVDLLIIATDTRSMSKKQASQETFKISKALESVELDWIYKKTDSVMRGHILDELIAILIASNLKQALLVPANPSFGRTISNGKYYINEKPLHQTGFSEDPEFALSSSDVLELLGTSEKVKTVVINPGEDIPKGSIAIGQACGYSDLKTWAKTVDKETLPAGAAEFFAALLESNGFTSKEANTCEPLILGEVKLYVCGSSFAQSKYAIERAKKEGKPVCEMPDDLFNNKGSQHELLENWTLEVLNAIEKNKSAIVAINKPIVSKPGFSKRLRELTAQLIEGVLSKTVVNELFIEGGATTSSIVGKINYKKFLLLSELAPGVIRMRVEEDPGVNITIKPGSYAWPDIIWNQKSNDKILY